MRARRPALALLVPALLGLGACAQPPQMSLPEAERYCSQNLSDPGISGVRAEPRISIGIGSGGYRGAGLGVDFTPDRAAGSSDPEMIFHRCVRSRSGQAPSKSLYQQPGWGGS